MHPTATVCLIIKNEGKYFAEWAAHYITLGFDRIIVYDNCSTDGTGDAILACAAIDRRISLIRWADPADGSSPQIAAYNDSLTRIETEWVAHFDSDELLVLKKHNTVGEFLSTAPDEAGAIAINWLVFGSSGETHYRPEPVAARFKMCARPDHGRNMIYKSFSRVACVSRMIVHNPVLSRGVQVFASGKLLEVWPDNSARARWIEHDVVQLNHYVLRSREEYEVKARRGGAASHQSRKFLRFREEANFWKQHDFNHVKDEAIAPWTQRAAPLREQFAAAIAKCLIPA